MSAPWQRGRWWPVLALGVIVTIALLSDRLFGTGLVESLWQSLSAKGG